MFKKLLVPLDQSSLAEQAIGQAAAIARASGAEIEVVMVHQSMPVGGFEDAPWNESLRTTEHGYLEDVAKEIGSGASLQVGHAMLKGEPVDMICRRVLGLDADLIVMTSHGRTGLSRTWLGSVADGVVRHAGIPVLLLRPIEGKTPLAAAHHLFKHVLVPLDGSSHSAEILSAATSLAKCSDAKITLLAVVQPLPSATYNPASMLPYAILLQDDSATKHAVESTTKELNETAIRLSHEGFASVDVQVVVAGSVARGILEFARTHDVDVIAMSTYGRGASRLLMGSVADKVIRSSGLPVLLQRPLGVHAHALQGTAGNAVNESEGWRK